MRQGDREPGSGSEQSARLGQHRLGQREAAHRSGYGQYPDYRHSDYPPANHQQVDYQHPEYGDHADHHAHYDAYADDAHGGSLLDDYESTEADEGRIPRVRRAARRFDPLHHHGGRHGRNRSGGGRRLVWGLGALVVVLLVVVAWLVVLPIYHYFNPSDYSGPGSGSVIVTVHADDGAQDIGETLLAKNVVASVRAFTDAAKANPKSQNIQPGTYRLRRQMSATNALRMLLSPAARVNADILVPEGATIRDVEKRLTVPACSDTTKSTTSCGPGLSRAQVQRAFRNVGSLGLPTDYSVNGKSPQSVEGFLFPATYFFPAKTTASDALSQMISKFADQARSIGFTSQAKALHLTPYQELIIASIAQSEAKYASDFPKVARVILNRLQQHIPLRVDATSAYAAKLKGLDPAKVIYATINSPYNTYTHSGLPPTPVGSPGVDAMNGAAHPASGNWLFYVNADAQGHLGFYSNEQQFVAAVDKCRANHWGCG